MGGVASTGPDTGSGDGLSTGRDMEDTEDMWSRLSPSDLVCRCVRSPQGRCDQGLTLPKRHRLLAFEAHSAHMPP